jgi:hypothetical protein
MTIKLETFRALLLLSLKSTCTRLLLYHTQQDKCTAYSSSETQNETMAVCKTAGCDAA